MNKINRIRNVSNEIFKSSTFHGLSNMFTTKRKLTKVVWLIFFTASLCSNIYIIYDNIKNYYNYDVITKINKITEMESELPTISICTDFPGFNKPIQDLILNCSINQNSSCQNNPENYYSTWESDWFDKCYTLNGGSNLKNESIDSIKIKRPGIDYGLSLKLKLDKINDKISTLYVLVHNVTKSPQEIRNKGIRLAPGTSNYLSVKKLLISKLEEPFNDCIKDPNSFTRNKTIIDVFKNSPQEKYSREICVEMCFGIWYLENNNCGCDSTFLNVNKECGGSVINKTFQTCRHDFKKKFLNSNVDEYCSRFCPIECDLYYLTVKASSARLPQSEIKSYQDNNQVIFSFNVYFENLEYSLMSQTAKTSQADFIANIGGSFGLFIGTSFLSFVELIELLINAFIILFYRPIKVYV